MKTVPFKRFHHKSTLHKMQSPQLLGISQVIAVSICNNDPQIGVGDFLLGLCGVEECKSNQTNPGTHIHMKLSQSIAAKAPILHVFDARHWPSPTSTWIAMWLARQLRDKDVLDVFPLPLVEGCSFHSGCAAPNSWKISAQKCGATNKSDSVAVEWQVFGLFWVASMR